MGPQDFIEAWERLCGGEKQPETCEFINVLPKVCPNRANHSLGQELCSLLYAGDELAGFVERHLLGCVIGLTKLVRELFHKLGSLAHEDPRLIFFQRHGDQSCPARVCAKAQGGMLHEPGFPSENGDCNLVLFRIVSEIDSITMSHPWPAQTSVVLTT